MGAACCVTSRDKAIVNGSGSELLHRNTRCSPTWSFHWDNRGRVAGEDTSVSWFSDAISRNDGSEVKYESACVSEDGSLSWSFQSRTWKKCPTSEGAGGKLRTPASDQSISRNISVDVNLEQVRESMEAPTATCSSPPKSSFSLPSASSFATSPLSSQSHVHPTSSTTTRWSLESKSLDRYSVREERPVMPSWSNESTVGSRGDSSDAWSMHAFSELMATSRRERWPFDNDKWGSHPEKISTSSSRISASPSVDLQTCGVCSKLLLENSLWSSQKIVISNEHPVVAVLTCGHVYHAECLEHMTPEIDKYDPACQICTLGEKTTHKLSEKAFKAEIGFKAKIDKRSRNRVVDGDIDDDPVVFNRPKTNGLEGEASSSNMKSSSRPFLWKHFSFGSKESSPPSENHSTRKKGLFWTKSSKT
ncbi:RING/U-box superfamily protein isoform 1 [Hibiscus syriacus]|uniref:RING/U-box superfamily protein isoform 1 n=1 Tax=Hibiscus syriacus TaxID=106335 RepID=A0A6A3BPQ9_HIBSY|nr:uncharacterized protein LOC120214811 [Hibiscus syriacus]KAE8716879.1 RING/U-box superfamily protein isoform 1 [Hibiscus syriacus]